MRKLEAVAFDMDGTILHTLPDLAACANVALAQLGLPEHSEREYADYMGDGGKRMIKRAMPPEATEEQSERAFELWRSLYIASGYPLTAPFPGIVDVLSELRKQGIRTAVLSNKLHEGTCVLAERHFPGLFDAVLGDRPPTPRKPDPTSLLRMLLDLGVRPETAAYVGDSNVDAQTARNAGVLFVGVAWGYDGANPLRADKLDAYARAPEDLLGLLQNR